MTKKRTKSNVQPNSKSPQEGTMITYASDLPVLSFTPGCILIGKFERGMERFATITNWGMVVGILSGLMSASVGSYPFLEPHLHLKFSLENLDAAGYGEKVGYINQGYNGKLLPRLANCIPAFGWNQLDFVAGQFVVRRKCEDVAYTSDESDWTKEGRNAFWKHAGLELLLRGKPLKLVYAKANTSRCNYAAVMEKLATMEPDERKTAIRQNIFNKIVVSNERKIDAIYARPGFVEPAHLAKVRLYEGGEIDANELVGKTIQPFLGNIQVRVPIAITAENLGRQLDGIRRSGLTIAVQ